MNQSLEPILVTRNPGSPPAYGHGAYGTTATNWKGKREPHDQKGSDSTLP